MGKGKGKEREEKRDSLKEERLYFLPWMGRREELNTEGSLDDATKVSVQLFPMCYVCKFYYFGAI